ncbi:hypothetical protein pdam_00005168 [Pocillopora damicornis]|uniref:Tudor domain-containing protein n=1 Tax=Pocillopora damicornis TaxID=46731 RepID=A0A3M6TND8_POCDA|nr:hypothetical protein pdam_00005168 [Pocillopora damicornis]
MALPQTVGFKAEAVDEEGVWCACTVEEVDDDYVIISFDGGNAEWNRRVCDPCTKEMHSGSNGELLNRS